MKNQVKTKDKKGLVALAKKGLFVICDGLELSNMRTKPKLDLTTGLPFSTRKRGK